MDENFTVIVDFVIDVLEGGDKLVTDSGGLTKFGISKRWHPTLDIANLTREQAINVYRQGYWEPSGAPFLSWPLDLVIFDAEVNQGHGVAHRILTGGGTWQDALLGRLDAYVQLPGPIGDGWPNRLLRLWHFARAA